MKELSDAERNKYYSSIRIEVRKRLKSSLIGCPSKSKFYQQAFETLSSYEADYFILNLFYENNGITIINFLYKIGALQNIIISDSKSIQSKYYSHIINVLENKGKYKSEDDVIFLRKRFSELVNTIKPEDFYLEDENRSPIIQKYSRWLFRNLTAENKADTIFQSFLLFIKIWNSFDYFFTQFNRKAILFYSICTNELENVSDQKTIAFFYRLYQDIKNILSGLFIDIEYIPLLDRKDSTGYKIGYIIKRDLFLNKVKEAEDLFSGSRSNTLLSAFRSIQASDNEKFVKRARLAVKSLLDNCIMPSDEELIKIGNLELHGKADDVRKELFQKFYLFDFFK